MLQTLLRTVTKSLQHLLFRIKVLVRHTIRFFIPENPGDGRNRAGFVIRGVEVPGVTAGGLGRRVADPKPVPATLRVLKVSVRR